MSAEAAPGDRGQDFRCAAASLERGEDVAGSASTVRAFLLLEHPGPWGTDALRDARLPDDLGPELARRCAEARVRPLLVRRTGGGSRDRWAWGRPRLFAAYADPRSPWLETADLDDPRAVLDLELAALRAGRSLGLTRSEEPVLAVCTHGRHDACCAELGRPVAAALAQAHPVHTWEVSHVGGDRFAANLLVLPHGLYYGRLDPATAALLGARVRAGRLLVDHLRGRSGLATPVQAAEVALRRRHDLTGIEGLRVVAVERQDEVTRVVLAAAQQEHTVVVRSRRDPAVHLTCRAVRENPPLAHEVVSVTP